MTSTMITMTTIVPTPMNTGFPLSDGRRLAEPPTTVPDKAAQTSCCHISVATAQGHEHANASRKPGGRFVVDARSRLTSRTAVRPDARLPRLALAERACCRDLPPVAATGEWHGRGAFDRRPAGVFLVIGPLGFAAAATHSGFRTVEALPMRLRDQVIGALNLFRALPGPFDPAE